MATACTLQMTVKEDSIDNTGDVVITVQREDFAPVSKGQINAEFVPEIDDLKIEIFKNPGEGQVRLYRDTYANTVKQEAINLNCADYRILASYGDSLAVGFEPQKIYYSGVYDFTLEPKELEQAEVVVSPSNVRASVVFGDDLKFDYPENFYAKVRSETAKGKVKSLRYDYDETRAGFVPAGKLRVELYVKVGDNEMYCPGPDVDVAGGTDLTFNVETVRAESEVSFVITISEPEKIDRTYTIPAVMLEKDSPQIDLGGLGENSYVLEPGDEPIDGLRMDMKADGEIAHCWLDVTSEYLASLGVPARLDLASENLGIEDEVKAEEVKAILEGVGLRWMSNMTGSRLAYLDFSGITRFITSTPCTPVFDADFTVELVDSRTPSEGSQHVGNIKTDTYSFTQVIPAPAIRLNGFEESKVLILEGNGVTYEGMNAELTAKGGIAHCWLNIDSPYLRAAGMIESKIDLANIDENGPTAAALRNIGLSWTPDMAGEMNATVDFSGITEYMDRNWCDGANAKFADFSLSLENGHYASEAEKIAEADVADFEYIIPSVSIRNDVVAGNVWAKKILNFSADCAIDQSAGITLPYELFRLQYKSGEEWIDVPSTSYQYPTLSCSRFNAVPATDYQFRAVYNNNPNLTVAFTSHTTEAELQIEGADFNKWERNAYSYYAEEVWGSGDEWLSRDWYQPLPGSIWAVNSMKTMPSVTTPDFTISLGTINYKTGETQTYKVFPTVTKYNTDVEARNYAAQLATIFVCNMATASNDGTGTLGAIGALLSVTRTYASAAGEMCIGSADASGNLTPGAYSFASRPSKVKVRYQYDSYNSDTGYIKFEFRSGSEVIATHEVKPGSASEWTDYTFDVPYTSLQKKVTSVYATFKSSSASTPPYKGNEARTLTVEATDYNVHRGSVLRIDDIEFIYE